MNFRNLFTKPLIITSLLMMTLVLSTNCYIEACVAEFLMSMYHFSQMQVDLVFIFIGEIYVLTIILLFLFEVKQSVEILTHLSIFLIGITLLFIGPNQEMADLLRMGEAMRQLCTVIFSGISSLAIALPLVLCVNY